MPKRIRTSDHQIRNLILYPAELWAQIKSRREGDLNPRYSYPYTSLAGKRLRPLGHLSKPKKNGEGGIRTHGCSHINGFQDRRLKPLGHLSIIILIL